MNIYERFGRQAEQLEQAIEAHERTLALLSALVRGEIQLTQVKMSDDGLSWQIVPLTDAE